MTTNNSNTEKTIVYYILEDYTLTQVDEPPSMDEYEIESELDFTQDDEVWTEITYKKKDEEEECGICERCGGESEDKDFRYCEHCDQQMLDDEYAAQQEESDDDE